MTDKRSKKSKTKEKKMWKERDKNSYFPFLLYFAIAQLTNESKFSLHLIMPNFSSYIRLLSVFFLSASTVHKTNVLPN